MAAFFKLSEKCVFYPYDGSTDAEEFLLRLPGGRQFRIPPLAKEILQSLDGKTSLDTIADRLQSRNVQISAAELQSFLEEQYGSLGVFENYLPAVTVGTTGRQARKSPIVPIFLHWRLLPAPIVALVSRFFRVLFNGFVVLAGILAMVASHYWLYRHELPDLFDDQVEVNIFFITGLALLSVLIHELGHASAVIRYGGSPGAIGFGLYLLLPAFYTDVSEVWRFPRRQRMVVDLAGIYFQQLVFCIFAFLSYTTGLPEFAVACAIVDTMALLTLNPVFQFDGYWFLADYLGLPELHRLAWAQLKRWVLRAKDAPALPPMRRNAYVIFLGYAIGCIGFIAILLRMEYRYLILPSKHFFAVLPRLASSLVVAFKAREFLKVGNYLLGFFYLVTIPLAAFMGVGVYTARIYRYFFRKNAGAAAVERA